MGRVRCKTGQHEARRPKLLHLALRLCFNGHVIQETALFCQQEHKTTEGVLQTFQSQSSVNK